MEDVMKRKFRPKFVADQSVHYKPHLKGYYFVNAMISIVDGIIGLCVAPFGKESILRLEFAEWNIMCGIDARKKAKN
jgi:hypothetical protein